MCSEARWSTGIDEVSLALVAGAVVRCTGLTVACYSLTLLSRRSLMRIPVAWYTTRPNGAADRPLDWNVKESRKPRPPVPTALGCRCGSALRAEPCVQRVSSRRARLEQTGRFVVPTR